MLVLSDEITFISGTGFKNTKPQRISSKKKNIEEYVLDETIIKAGSEYIWLWVAIEPKNKEILGISISKERNMFVAERFLSKIVEKYGDHPVSTDGGTWYLSIHKRASF